jgi:hypothetical protein
VIADSEEKNPASLTEKQGLFSISTDKYSYTLRVTLSTLNNASNAVFSTALRLSSAESLNLREIEMTIFAYMSELAPFCFFSRNPVTLPFGALQCALLP